MSSQKKTHRRVNFAECRGDGSAVERGMICPPSSLDSSLSEGAARRVRKFYRWRELNPEAYLFAESMALTLVDAGQRIGGQRLVEAIRARDFIDLRGKPTKTDNSLAPLLVRAIIERYPEAAPLCERRTRAYDGVSLWGGATRG